MKAIANANAARASQRAANNLAAKMKQNAAAKQQRIVQAATSKIAENERARKMAVNRINKAGSNQAARQNNAIKRFEAQRKVNQVANRKNNQVLMNARAGLRKVDQQNVKTANQNAGKRPIVMGPSMFKYPVTRTQ
jgi:hypothetical protein